jgi:FAD/FMN-containing dehydrogenase
LGRRREGEEEDVWRALRDAVRERARVVFPGVWVRGGGMGRKGRGFT